MIKIFYRNDRIIPLLHITFEEAPSRLFYKYKKINLSYTFDKVFAYDVHRIEFGVRYMKIHFYADKKMLNIVDLETVNRFRFS